MRAITAWKPDSAAISTSRSSSSVPDAATVTVAVDVHRVLDRRASRRPGPCTATASANPIDRAGRRTVDGDDRGERAGAGGDPLLLLAPASGGPGRTCSSRSAPRGCRSAADRLGVVDRRQAECMTPGIASSASDRRAAARSACRAVGAGFARLSGSNRAWDPDAGPLTCPLVRAGQTCRATDRPLSSVGRAQPW